MWACGSRLHDAGVQAERRFVVITDSLGMERDRDGGDCLWDRGSPCCDCGPRCGCELGTNRASSAASRRWPLLRTAGGNWDQEEGSTEVVDELTGLLGLLEDEAFSYWIRKKDRPRWLTSLPVCLDCLRTRCSLVGRPSGRGGQKAAADAGCTI